MQCAVSSVQGAVFIVRVSGDLFMHGRIFMEGSPWHIKKEKDDKEDEENYVIAQLSRDASCVRSSFASPTFNFC